MAAGKPHTRAHVRPSAIARVMRSSIAASASAAHIASSMSRCVMHHSIGDDAPNVARCNAAVVRHGETHRTGAGA